jgi:hypothetical protein
MSTGTQVTIPVEINWKQAGKVIELALTKGTPEGKKQASEELQNMARAADAAKELLDAVKNLMYLADQMEMETGETDETIEGIRELIKRFEA